MQRIFGLVCFLFFTATFAFSASDLLVNTTESGVARDTAGIVATNQTIQTLETRKLEIQSTIALEEGRTIESIASRDMLLRRKDELEHVMGLLEELYDTLGADDGTNFSAASDEMKKIIAQRDTTQDTARDLIHTIAKETGTTTIPHQIDTDEIAANAVKIEQALTKKLAEYDTKIREAEQARETFLAEKQQELEQVSLELDRAKLVKRTQISSTLIQILIYIGVFLGLILARYISGKILMRFQEDFTRSHREAMWFVHRWSFRAIFLIAFLVLFSSEFAAFLPFIAIIATAIGFAMRDVVYSFIAWFVIGASDGFQEGDFIELGDIRGKVFKITPLLTTLEEYGSQGVTGKMLSFPNKVVFEKNIRNLSRAHGFTLISFDFVITHTSDIDRAREILMEVIGQQDLTLYYNSRNVVNKLRYTYGYRDEDIRPRIDIMVDTTGIILRAKVFVHVEDMIDIQTTITEEFCKRIQKETVVMLQSKMVK